MKIKTQYCATAILAFLVFCFQSGADTHYVSPVGTNNSPYLTWADATTNIQWAITVASINDTVLVTNGAYCLTNQLAITNITVISVNGYSNTSVYADPTYTTRCFYVVSTGVVDGFTISNGYLSGSNNISGGAGAYVATNARIRNCYFVNNTYSNIGVGGGGGAIFLTAGGMVSNCVITGNRCAGARGSGAGIYIYGAANDTNIVETCWISNNLCTDGAGGAGVAITNSGQMRNCLINNNTNMAAGGNGGGVLLGNSSLQTNNNSYGLINCTIVNNWSTNAGGGIATFGPSNYIVNCIIVSNSSFSNVFPNVYNTGANSNNFWYCCVNVTSAPLAANRGNITNDPVFVNSGAGNWRLQGNSPCINFGSNQDWMTSAVDFDGMQRILQGTVDMGAYESAFYLNLYKDGITNTVTVTNTVMRGASTNFAVYMSSTNNASIYWRATITNNWVSLNATNGTVASDSALTINITDSALSLSPGTYSSRLTVDKSTGIVDMTMNVAEFGLSPTQMTATLKQFSTTSDTVRIWNTGAGDLPYSVSTNVSWLTVSPASGVLTGQTSGATNDLTVVFTNTLLSVGTYSGALTLKSLIDGSTLNINVEMTVTNGLEMIVNPLSLTGSVMMGQNLASQTFCVSNNSATEQLGYNVAVNRSWLTVTPSNGVLDPMTTNNLTVNYQTSLLTTNSAGAPSNYNATIVVTATNSDVLGSPANVAVNLTVNPKAQLALNKTSVTNIITEGRDAPACNFEIWNGNGYYTLSYTLSDNVDWFLLAPTSGTSTGEHDVITATFSTAGLSAGVSNAQIKVVYCAYDGTHWSTATTQTVALLLMVIPAPTLAMDASSLYEFSARFGHPAGSASFRVWNSTAAGDVMQYSIASNVSWLAASPASGVSGGEENEITLTCNAKGLCPGKHTGALTISGTDQATGIEVYNSPININVELTIIGSTVFDFGGDASGASDLVVYQESSGLWNIKNLSTGFTTNAIYGGDGYVPVVGDYGGDGRSDLGLYRYSSGYWYVRPITNQQITVFGGSYWAGPKLAGAGGFVPVFGDYDGDGLTDPAMYCEQSGVWSVLFSASGHAFVSRAFGGPGYVSVPADYDGDGITDLGVYNETMAQWYVLYSSENYRANSGIFGGPGFTAVPADYDGDGKADGGVYNESNGLWIILPSSTLTSSGYAPVSGVFGGPGFIPVPADYTGDGMADACVYDEATGNWYIVAIDGARVAWPVQHGGYGFSPVKP